MQLSRIIAACGGGMLLASIALAQTVRTDYANGTDFSRYKTVMWIKEPAAMNPLINQRIVSNVNAALASKGMQLVTADADIGVAAHTATEAANVTDFL